MSSPLFEFLKHAISAVRHRANKENLFNSIQIRTRDDLPFSHQSSIHNLGMKLKFVC